MSGPTVKELAEITDPVLRRLGGMIRRMVVSVTSKPIWKLIGVKGLDGKDEVIDAEAFTGVGFYARPPNGGKPEAILVNVGDARVPVIVASRDEKTFASVRALLGGGKPEAGETIVFNGAVVVYLKANGTAEIRTPGGTAVALATKADLDVLQAWLSALVLPVTTAPGGGQVAGPPPAAPPTAAGTSVLKGQ